MIEHRLYYNDEGEILFYTCEKPNGKFLVIDAQTYAECRFDSKVINGKLIKNNYYTITKLTKSIEGTKCSNDNVAIVVGDTYNGDTCCWTIETNESR